MKFRFSILGENKTLLEEREEQFLFCYFFVLSNLKKREEKTGKDTPSKKQKSAAKVTLVSLISRL
jgi:hypothetical protein